MHFLERDTQLAQLAACVADTADGHGGRCALVFGEAGIGKTLLLRRFAATLPAGVHALTCGCEALFTPRPLGPLVDLADALPPSLAQALHAGRTDNGLFPTLLAHLAGAQAARVLVIEDLQWADTATLDFVRYAARRLHQGRLVLVLSYRDDPVTVDHPLRRVLGELPAATTRRIGLAPLSAQAVQRLAGPLRRDGARLHAISSGNPFYVTELLGQPGSGVPLSVSDAVLARLAPLSPPARALAELVSTCPGRADAAIVAATIGPFTEQADECRQAGLLELSGEGLAFRHELARLAVHEAIAPARRAALHATVFHALTAVPDSSAARRVHHAEQAHLAAEVARLAPQAAREASVAGAHREAVRLFGLALKQPPVPQVRAQLLEQMATEALLINQHEAAIQARLEALTLRRSLGQQIESGANLCALGRLHWFVDGGKPIAENYARQAIAVLEGQAPHRELAIAYSTLAHLKLVGEDMPAAMQWGERAIGLAQSLGDTEGQVHALNTVACARLRLGADEQAWSMLQQSCELALQHGLEADAARAYNNLFILSVVHGRYAGGLVHAEEGIRYSEAKGLDVFTVRIRIRRAYLHLMRGRWADADADLAELAAHHQPAPAEAVTRDFVAALLALRRGQAGAEERLVQAAQGMQVQHVQIWFTSTAAALAEAAWLRDDPGAACAAARPALAEMAAIKDAWRGSELAGWLALCGEVQQQAPQGLQAHVLEAQGRWPEAAAAWQALSRPYDQARALTRCGAEGLRQALALFESLGAAAAADLARRSLRALGAAAPRGPSQHARQDALGLTPRERQVFELLREGLTNAQIAERLHRSARTVEHHVEAVLAKAGSRRRAELIAKHPRTAAKTG